MARHGSKGRSYPLTKTIREERKTRAAAFKATSAYSQLDLNGKIAYLAQHFPNGAKKQYAKLLDKLPKKAA